MRMPKPAWLPLGLALLVGCDTPAGGKWPRQGVADRDKANPPAAVVTATDLRLQASVERDGYVVGEPIYLILRLENAGNQAQRVFGSLDPGDGAVEVLLTGPDGRERRLVPLVETDQDSSIMVELAPGASLGAAASVFFGADGWTFPAPGSHRLTAVYRTPAGAQVREARSAALELRIGASADGSGEFLADGSAASLEAGKFLTWQAGDHLTAGRDRLENLLTRYPGSDLTHYVRSALSRSHATPFTDYRTREVRPANCELALEHLRTVVAERLPAYLRAQNALIRARCAARGQNTAAARAAIRDARQIAGDLPEYRGILRQIEELERNLATPRR